MGDGDSRAIFIKVLLGSEILSILRGILEDELMEFVTDLRFYPHVTLFTKSDLTPEKEMKFLKTGNPSLISAVSVRAMSFRERKTAALEGNEPVEYHF